MPNMNEKYTLDITETRGWIWHWLAQLWDENGRCVKITVHRSTDAAVRWGFRMASRDSKRRVRRQHLRRTLP